MVGVKLAIVGSRSFEDYDLLKRYIFDHYNINEIACIVSGGAKGADSLAKRFSIEYSIKLIEFLPEWEKYGKGADYVRNKLIWENADEGLAFWDGKSKGTQHSFEISKKLNKTCHIVMI